MAGRREATIGELKQKASQSPEQLTVTEVRSLRELDRMKASDTALDVPLELAAEYLGTSPRNVKELANTGKIQRGRRNRYDVRSIATYLREYRDKRFRSGGRADVKADSEYWLNQCRRFTAGIREYELRVKNGELLPRAEVLAEWQRVGEVMKVSFEGIERRHGKEIGDEIRESIEHAIGELRPV